MVPVDSQHSASGFEFTSDELISLMDGILGRKLGDIDTAGVFERNAGKVKVTGIAGDVIEQSVLGYRPNPGQSPDIVVDGVPTEVKVTGLSWSSGKGYDAKEPMTITAVSVDSIVEEEFESSNFWHKVEQMLLVYYHYNSQETVPAPGYARFPVCGYQLHRFDQYVVGMLKKDWTLIRDFIRTIKRDYEHPEDGYPRLSSELRDRLMMIETAPKWPNNPRFRLRRSVVSEIVKAYFDGRVLNESQMTMDGVLEFDEMDRRCTEITRRYSGYTVDQLIDEFGLDVPDRDRMSKSIGESIVVRMFGGEARKMSEIGLFRVMDLAVKTVCMTSKGGHTEDTKMMPVDFTEFLDPDRAFEDSAVFQYFMGRRFICIVFQEADRNKRFRDNVFIGFKRFMFPEGFVYDDVRRTWNEVRQLVWSGGLRDEAVISRTGAPRVNRTGVPTTSPNFPKSVDHDVFIRGSGSDSTRKPVELCGVRMYRQYVWVKGSKMIEMLDSVGFIG